MLKKRVEALKKKELEELEKKKEGVGDVKIDGLLVSGLDHTTARLLWDLFCVVLPGNKSKCMRFESWERVLEEGWFGYATVDYRLFFGRKRHRWYVLDVS